MREKKSKEIKYRESARETEQENERGKGEENRE